MKKKVLLALAAVPAVLGSAMAQTTPTALDLDMTGATEQVTSLFNSNSAVIATLVGLSIAVGFVVKKVRSGAR